MWSDGNNQVWNTWFGELIWCCLHISSLTTGGNARLDTETNYMHKWHECMRVREYVKVAWIKSKWQDVLRSNELSLAAGTYTESIRFDSNILAEQKSASKCNAKRLGLWMMKLMMQCDHRQIYHSAKTSLSFIPLSSWFFPSKKVCCQKWYELKSFESTWNIESNV